MGVRRIKRYYLAMGVNSERKSVVPQQVGGLGLRMMTFLSCKAFQSQKSKQDNVLEAARTQTGL
jgi:hypothetical protein